MSPTGVSWLDPELVRLPEGAFMTVQDDGGRILLAALDETDGSVASWQVVGEGGAPLLTTFNGPEFGVDARGPSVWYTRTVPGGSQVARVAFRVDRGPGPVVAEVPTASSCTSTSAPEADGDPLSAHGHRGA